MQMHSDRHALSLYCSLIQKGTERTGTCSCSTTCVKKVHRSIIIAAEIRGVEIVKFSACPGTSKWP